jgi:hypothetical protein
MINFWVVNAWEKGCQEVRVERGGKEGNIWNLQYIKIKRMLKRQALLPRRLRKKRKGD